MEPNEFSDMFGDSGDDIDTTYSFQERDNYTQTSSGDSLTALVVDAWDVNKGTSISISGPPTTCDSYALTDFHAAAYQIEPQLVEKCTDERRHQFVKSLMEMPDFHELRETTCLNEFASELAALQFANEFSTLKEKDEKRKQNPRKGDDIRQESDLMNSAGKAVKNAEKDVEECMDAMRGLGGDGADPSSMDPKKVAEIFKKVRNNPHLRAICEKAGRYRRLARSKQRQKAVHGRDDVVGVEKGGDVERLVGSELAMLCDPRTRLDVVRRLVDNQAMCIQRRGVENVGKGPIIICVDESGSMHGEPIQNAKAFALAMAWIARQQKRYCCLISYAGGTAGYILELPPNKWDEARVIEWLVHFFSGGTTMDVPLGELPKWWDKGAVRCPKGKTDLIIITDAIVNVPEDMARNFNEWKKREKVRCISLVLAKDAGELSKVSEEIHLVQNVDVNEAAVGRCLSI